MPTAKALMFLLLLAAPAQAEDWLTQTISRSVEGPGQAALMKLIARPDTTLSAFQTDGCSGGLSDAWRVIAHSFPDLVPADQSRPPWEDCCITHDRAYHNASGATDIRRSYDARLTADVALRACVIQNGEDTAETLAQQSGLTPQQVMTAYGSIADTMFLAVRVGGMPCSGLPWRWGYGYPNCTALTGVLD